MARSTTNYRPVRPRSLRMESLEQRDLLSVTLVPGTETFKSFEFTAASALAVGGTWRVHNPEYAIPFNGRTTEFHGTANFTSRNEATVAVDVITARGSYNTPRGGGRFSLANGSITDGTVTRVGKNPYRFTGQLAGDVHITGLVRANTTLSGPMNGTFNGAKHSLNLSYKKGDVALRVRGAIKPQSAEPFSVTVNSAVWTPTGMEVDVTAPGGVHKVAAKSGFNHNTPVAFVQLYWASGPDFAQQIGPLKDRLPIYWNEASAKYTVTALPMPPPAATHLLLVPRYDGQVGTVVPMELPVKPSLSIDDVQTVEGNSATTGLDFHVTLSAPLPFVIQASYLTIDQTAKVKNLDYNRRAGSVIFAPGETEKTITIRVRGDTKIEADETFAVQLTGPIWATVTKPLGVGTIVSDDLAPPALDVALQTWSAADAGAELASYFAADRRRNGSTAGLVAARDAVFTESVL